MAGEWPITTFAKAPIEIIDGDRGKNYPSQSEFHDTGHCLFLNAGNVTESGFDFSSCAFISEEKDRLLRKGKLARHDVVLTTRGTVGNSAYFDDSVPYEILRINSGMVILRAKQRDLHPRYLYMFIRSKLLHEQVSALRTGSAQPQLPIRDIQRIEIPIPPLPEQRAIAHILGTLDDKIELNRRMNQTLEEIARAIFKSWFVDFDPVHAKAEGREPVGMDPETAALFPDSFRDSPRGEIPKGWGIGCLGDIAARHRETIKTEDIEDGSPYVALDDIPRASIMLSSWKDAEGISSSKSRFCKGDVLFGKLRPYFHKVVVAPTDGICSTDIVVIRAKQEVWSTFVLMLCSSKKFISYNAAVMTGTKMPRTNWRDMSKYEMALPPDDLLPAFQVVASPLVRQIVKSIHESRVLSAARDSLLPHLLSGKIGRLEDDK